MQNNKRIQSWIKIVTFLKSIYHNIVSAYLYLESFTHLKNTCSSEDINLVSTIQCFSKAKVLTFVIRVMTFRLLNSTMHSSLSLYRKSKLRYSRHLTFSRRQMSTVLVSKLVSRVAHKKLLKWLQYHNMSFLMCTVHRKKRLLFPT